MELMGPRSTGVPPVSSDDHRSDHGRDARATDFCLSVFSDNAGVIAFDETDAVCFKVETHNHPSAIEPYGGSATGVGGVIRDILGTGLGAKPVANTDVFCVAYPDAGSSTSSIPNRKSKIQNLPKGVIHPKRILQQVVAGVRDYGNRMGIPTVNGAVYFDDRYLGNPLVFCGCVGLLPRDKIHKAAGPGDAVVVMGGRTGRDGIHGATFSSAELTDTHADEFSHAVQIGNAITEKKMADMILQARDRGLFTAITDCGAGGLSSAVGEMGEKIGAEVDLDKVPLKYAGLRYDEIWISEAQERMVLSVPREHLDELLQLAGGEDVETTVIGTFGTPGRDLVLRYRGTEVGRVSMDFLHHGIPMPTRKAVVEQRGTGASPVQPSERTVKHGRGAHATVGDRLTSLLAHPNIASKHWIIRQYDHEVQGGSVIKPLTGPLQVGPSDAAVLRPKLDSHRGVAIGCGLAPHVQDPYRMAVAAIDEAIRNVTCVGARPGRIAILDNFCWPSVDDERTMGDLVRTCEACRDAALAYRIPFISGKDSLHNQFTNSETGEVIRIPNTLLISAIAVIDDVRRCVTMDLKRAGNQVFLIGPQPAQSDDAYALEKLPAVHRAVSAAIAEGLVASCHDASDGGVLVAAAEMCIASDLGLDLTELAIPAGGPHDPDALFAERPGCYLIEVSAAHRAEVSAHFQSHAVTVRPFAGVVSEPRLRLAGVGSNETDVAVADLRRAWRGTLDW
jgi:phosphoribosylformylglycinamidine synthase